MSSPLVFGLPGQTDFADQLAHHLDAAVGQATMRRFPDGETYVRVAQPCKDRQAVIVCSLAEPDRKTLPLFFLADTLRDLGAARVGLVAPYLAYMRQDDRFSAGEGITSRYFAHMISRHVDWLVTVDPHLHRYDSLQTIYSVETRCVHAAPLVAHWVNRHVERPVLIGPDAESAQWIGPLAEAADAPQVVLEKERLGDHAVDISPPAIDRWSGHTPVVFDDIISTGHTMIATIDRLREADLKAPVVVGIHGLFADGAQGQLMEAGAARVVTTNTVSHSTNAVDISELTAQAVASI